MLENLSHRINRDLHNKLGTNVINTVVFGHDQMPPPNLGAEVFYQSKLPMPGFRIRDGFIGVICWPGSRILGWVMMLFGDTIEKSRWPLCWGTGARSSQFLGVRSSLPPTLFPIFMKLSPVGLLKDINPPSVDRSRCIPRGPTGYGG